MAMLLCLLLFVTMLPISALATEDTEPAEEAGLLEQSAQEPEAADGDELPGEEAPDEPEIPDEPEAAEPVELHFVLTPEAAELTVYTIDEWGEKQEIAPAEDGAYRLLPGTYSYTAVCEGFAPALDVALLVEAGAGPLEITVALAPAETERTEDAPIPDEVTMVPMAVDGEDVPTSGTCGENVTWSLSADGTLTISGTGEMKNYGVTTTWGDELAPWRQAKDRITSVIIENGVTHIGACAFLECFNLANVEIPNSIVSIGSGAFEHCANLTHLAIPAGVSELEGFVFMGCCKLKTAGPMGSGCDIEFGWDAEIPGDAFEYADYLETITLPETVKIIRFGAFSGCSNLARVVLPAGVETVEGYTFYDCTKLISAGPSGSGCSIEYPWTTEIPDSAFGDANCLKRVVLPQSITRIGQEAFEDCTSLKSITIPDNVTSIGFAAFARCESLEEVTLPQDLDEIGGFAFGECSKLKRVIIPDGVTKIGYAAFKGCEDLSYVRIPSSATDMNYDDGALGSGAFAECPKLKSAGPIGSNSCIEYGWTEIPEWAFRQCDGLESVIIPDSITSIGMYAFESCSNLTSVAISEGITSIPSGLFADCSSLESIEIPKSVNRIGSYAFSSCSNLGSIVIPEGITSIESGLFYNCSSLESIEIPKSIAWIADNVFYACDSLTDVFFTGSRAEWDRILLMDEGNAPLKSAAIHFGVTSPYDSLGYAYTITFNKNASKASGTTKKMSGKVTSKKTLTPNGFKLTGHTFVGWNTRADGSGTFYADKTPVYQVITRNNQKLTLYAQWAVTTYAISYNANGGTGAPASQTKEYGKSIALSSAAPTRTGYTFQGWATSQKNASAGKVSYKPGAVYKSNAKLSLYAVWKADSYKLIYHGNGSTKGSTATATITYNKAFTFKNGGFTKTGYVLKGWSLTAHAPAVDYSFDYAAGQKLTAAQCAAFAAARGYAGTVDLYAVWGPTEYKITYEAKPASVGAALRNGNAAKYNAVNGITFAPASAAGYDFEGFYSDAACKKPLSGFEPGTTGAKKVYLKFTPHSYTICFDANGGAAKSGMTATNFEGTIRKVGTSYTLPAFSKMFTPPMGYHFTGWDWDTGASCTTLKDKQKVKDLATADGATVTLKAKYDPNGYTVVFSANGGTFTDKKSSRSVAAKYDAELSVPSGADLRERAGYRFVGWNVKNDGSGGTTYTDKVKNLSAANGGKVTLYAVWSYEITLDGNGGTLEGGAASKTVTLIYKSKAMPGDEGFTRPGCTFRGWTTTKAALGKGIPIKDAGAVKPGVTVYAAWKTTYTGITVVLHSNNDENLTKELSAKTSADSLPTLAELSWNLKSFQGWALSADGSGTKYADGESLSRIATKSNTKIDLYAIQFKGVSQTFLDQCSAEYREGPYFAALSSVKLTGDYIEDMIAIACSQEGYHEGNSRSDYDGRNTSGYLEFTEYNRYCGNSSGKDQGWCNFFVMWCIDAADIPDSVYPKGANIFAAADVARMRERGIYHDYTGQELKRGDMVFTGGHIYIVENAEGGVVHSVEGNWGDCVSRNTNHNYGEIQGIIRLQY
ncbi:MAG: leucine-rich repeat protein [Oscillospiraceae bacterium]|nr:leucine-rich repeat protein [Oscillospiraceae bacterium]